MAYGNELVLGWQFKDWGPVLEALKLPTIFANRLCEIATSNEWKAAARPITKKLLKAWTASVKRMGFWNIRDVSMNGLVEYEAATPLGRREFGPFDLHVYFDPRELGERPDTATLCVPISSRYRPCFADWKDEHGTLWPVVFDAELQKMMKIAKTEICKVLPIFETAVWIVKEQHY